MANDNEKAEELSTNSGAKRDNTEEASQVNTADMARMNSQIVPKFETEEEFKAWVEGGALEVKSSMSYSIPSLMESVEVTYNKENSTALTLSENCEIPENCDFRNYGLVNFSGCKIPQNMHLDNKVIFSNVEIPEGLNLSRCESIQFNEGCKISKDTPLPKYVTFNNVEISADLDLSQCENVQFINSRVPEGIKLPKNISFNNTQIPEGLELSKCESVEFINGKVPNGQSAEDENISNPEIPTSWAFDGTNITKDVNLPKNVKFNCAKLPEGLDLRKCEKITLENVQYIPENVRFPAKKIEIKGNCSEVVRKRIIEHNAKVAELSMNNRVAARFGNRLLDANATFDKAMNQIMTGIEKNAPAIMKNIDNMLSWVSQPQAKAIEKAAEAFMKTPLGKKVMAEMTEKGITTIAKSAGKKMPLVCFAVGCYLGYERFKEGEPLKGVAEVISGVVGNIPVYGTVASSVIDVGLAASDAWDNAEKQYNATHITTYNSPQAVRNVTEEQAKNREAELKGAETGQIMPGDVTYSTASGIRQNQAFIFNRQIVTEEDIERAAEEYSKECEEAVWATMDKQIAREENQGIIISGEAKRRYHASQEQQKQRQINNAKEVTHSHNQETRVKTGATVRADNIKGTTQKPELPAYAQNAQRAKAAAKAAAEAAAEAAAKAAAEAAAKAEAEAADRRVRNKKTTAQINQNQTNKSWREWDWNKGNLPVTGLKSRN